MGRTAGIAASLLAAAALLPAGARAQEQSSTIETVTVTAQKRAQPLKDVPISITAITSQELKTQGVSGAQSLSLVTPGLNYAVQGPFAQPTIRGIGTSVTGPGADANVSLYIDGVYQPNQIANIFEFNNVSQIEIAKGPQGTLFGRNATGGAISVRTLDPTFDQNAKISASYGSYNQVRVSAYGNTNLSDTLAANLAVLYVRDDGYSKNLATGTRLSRNNTIALRGKVLWQPREDLTFTLSANYADVFDNTGLTVNTINRNTVLRQTYPGLTFPSDPYHVDLDTDPRTETKSQGVSLTAKYDTPYGTLTSISSYEKVSPYLLADIDGTQIPASTARIWQPERTMTQEINFASDNTGWFNWIGGVFLYDDKAPINLISSPGYPAPTVAQIQGKLHTGAQAVYAEAHLTFGKWAFIAGGRYSSEVKSEWSSLSVPAFGGVIAKQRGHKHWDSFTPRASVRYSINDDSNVYFTYSQGFKSGNYNLTTVSSTPVNPEKVRAYEVGYKFAGPRITFNTSAYYYDYRDIQVQIQTNVGGNLTTLLQNAASAKIWGMDADLDAILNENWRLRAGAAYTHARYDHFANAVITTPIPGGGNMQAPGDASGNHLVRAPDFTGFLTLQYNHELMTGYLDASVTASYSSGFYWDPGNRLKDDPYTIVNAQLGWSPEDGHYRIALWAKNLADETYYTYVTETETGDHGAFGRPRTFGVEFNLNL